MRKVTGSVSMFLSLQFFVHVLGHVLHCGPPGTPRFPCWLHTVGVVPAKRTLLGCGVVYDQRLSLMCNSDDRCLRQPWPDCGPLRDGSHIISSSSSASEFIWMTLILLRAKSRLCRLQLEALADGFALPCRAALNEAYLGSRCRASCSSAAG